MGMMDRRDKHCAEKSPIADGATGRACGASADKD
jgi:hypothetical protein